ncbi:MAG: F0F1 ATP synthase subunit epsilon [Candidatus Liberibacter ctenarytainae]|uniref:ATP synthase epsilon chain n=1 Tax=Candidatus Liberibacter ctenarytainae TaxID=2020335 RepID=A0A937DLX9_9HYPH|nr:F0F1 ATP synthase subunit epsilon [Candidatus Liberibacter ctenarytainae]
MSLVNDFYFELISPEKGHFSGKVRSVILPSESGDMTILAGHSSVLVRIKPGIITVELPSRDVSRYVVVGGISHSISSRCTVLAEDIFAINGAACIEAIDKRFEDYQSILDNLSDVEQRSQLEQFLMDLFYLRSRVSSEDFQSSL